MNIPKIKLLDQAVVKASKKIKVLNALAWPVGLEEKFLNDWRKGNAQLPVVTITPPNVKDNVAALDEIAWRCDLGDPVEKFLSETALSYANAGRMLMNVGTPDFTTYSIKLYGRPDF